MSTLHILLAGEPGPALDRFAAELAAALRQRGRDAAILRSTPDELASCLAAAAGNALCLLMGLSAPAADAEREDARWRAALQAAGQPFRVIHGKGAERLEHALRAIDAALVERPARITNWTWSCDKCSDAQCEHQLFRALVDQPAG